MRRSSSGESRGKSTGPAPTVDLYELHPGQDRLIREAGRFNVVACGRRWGKTILGIDLAIDPALDGYPVGWFAPEYKLLTEAWRELKDILGPTIRRADEQQKRIELKTGGVIEAWAFDRNPNAGRSRKYKRVIVDEAAHCDNLETVWTRALRPTLTDFKGDAWFLSSPNARNYFHTLYQQGKTGRPGWRSWTFPSVTNPKLDPAEIEDARLDLPEAIFRQEYLAEFLAESAQQLIPDEWIDRCYRDSRPAPQPIRYLSCDLSKGTGRDRTVVMVCDGLGLLDLAVSSEISVGGAAELVAAKARQWGVDHERITFDAGGWAGSDMQGYLEAIGIPDALGYFGNRPGGTQYKNRRMRSAWSLRRRLDPGRPRITIDRPPVEGYSLAQRRRIEAQTQVGDRPPFHIPAGVVGQHWESLRRELSELRYQYDQARLELERKEDLVARLGHSPDLADTLIMNASLWSD